ncbi:MAG: DUF4115 domain-containing protein, partial [Proteobacteria bacterium]|nr:DUF4115 domain-containing protein [Pseudomonadota bacterium]
IPVSEPPAIQREAVNPVVAAMLGDEAAADTAAPPAPPAPPVGGDVAVQAASLPSAAVAAGQDEGATPGPGAREYGATDGPARIVLEATEENWIQVRSRTNQAIFTQILHGGDRYYVPAEDGLSLTTGKAGALIVTVDGKRLNALGAVGAVRRGVPLDVGSLLQEPGPAAIAAED